MLLKFRTCWCFSQVTSCRIGLPSHSYGRTRPTVDNFLIISESVFSVTLFFTTANENVELILSAGECNQLKSNDGKCSRNPIQSESKSESESESNPEGRAKAKYAEFVSMTNDEYLSLVAELGEEGAKKCIEILDNYKGANGKKYKSDYRAIRSWVIKRHLEEAGKGGKAYGIGNKGCDQERPQLNITRL